MLLVANAVSAYVSRFIATGQAIQLAGSAAGSNVPRMCSLGNTVSIRHKRLERRHPCRRRRLDRPPRPDPRAAKSAHRNPCPGGTSKDLNAQLVICRATARRNRLKPFREGNNDINPFHICNGSRRCCAASRQPVRLRNAGSPSGAAAAQGRTIRHADRTSGFRHASETRRRKFGTCRVPDTGARPHDGPVRDRHGRDHLPDQRERVAGDPLSGPAHAGAFDHLAPPERKDWSAWRSIRTSPAIHPSPATASSTRPTAPPVRAGFRTSSPTTTPIMTR